MSVFTTVSRDALVAWLARYSLGELVHFEGIAAGIENTNYFVTTAQGRYVLTLFEKLGHEELPFYLHLMSHLADHGIPSPKPIANEADEVLGTLEGKPAALVTCLPGRDIEQPSPRECALVGAMLASMHRAGASYRTHMPNPRGPKWWRAASREVAPFLDAAQAKLLEDEVHFQALHRHEDLPRGAIHADLFRDNVLWHEGAIGGVIDFYFACTDALLYDVAITVNDWCIEADGSLDPARTTALLDAYRARRPVTAPESSAWPVMLRAGALRFWVSRLYDFHLPRPGELTHAKDPEHFRRILEIRIASHPDACRWLT